MMSRCPTMTFSTSARSRSKAATNSWTRASCVILLSFHDLASEPSRYYSKQALDHSPSARNVADFQIGPRGHEPRRSFLKHRGSSCRLRSHEQVDRERSPAAGADDDRVHVER